MHKYKQELRVEVSKRKTQSTPSYVDMNMSLRDDFFSNIPKNGSYEEEFKFIPLKIQCAHSYKLGRDVARFVKSYATQGRSTVLRSIFHFLSFQYNNGHKTGAKEGVVEHFTQLKSDIRTGKVKEQTAQSKASVINKFLIQQGEINKKIQFTFSNGSKMAQLTGNSSDYSSSEFNTVIHVAKKLYFACSDLIKELVPKVNEGTLPRKALLDNKSGCYRPIEFNINGKKYAYEAYLSNLPYLFNSISFVLFTYYTQGNTTPLTTLTEDDLTTDEDGNVHSKPLFKARAFKFVRYGIGDSDIDVDKVGVRWYEDFISVRKLLLEQYKKQNTSGEYQCLFFSAFIKDNSLTIIDKFTLSLHNVNGSERLFWYLQDKEVSLPVINVQKIRKACEQLIDKESKDPLLVTAKAQHNWETYQSNYAKGNPLENITNVSNALRDLHDLADKTFTEREKIAKEHGFRLIGDEDKGYRTSANGLGCSIDGEKTKQEKSFERKNNAPKMCANILECLDCNKCGIIDSVENTYELLSFKQAVLLNKPIYSGSKKANSMYSEITTKIDNALTLVSSEHLARAERKINREGISEIWNHKV